MRTEHQPGFTRHHATGWPIFRQTPFQGFRGGVAIDQPGYPWRFRFFMLQIAQGDFPFLGRISRLGKLTDFRLDAAVFRLLGFHCRLVILDQWLGSFGLFGFILPDRLHEKFITG